MSQGHIEEVAICPKDLPPPTFVLFLVLLELKGLPDMVKSAAREDGFTYHRLMPGKEAPIVMRAMGCFIIMEPRGTIRISEPRWCQVEGFQYSE